jgi:hypothetical protein
MQMHYHGVLVKFAYVIKIEWSGYDCKVFSHISCNRTKDQESPPHLLRCFWSGPVLNSFNFIRTCRNTEEKSEPECATTLEQVKVTSGSKQPAVYSGALEELAVSVPLVAPIMLP